MCQGTRWRGSKSALARYYATAGRVSAGHRHRRHDASLEHGCAAPLRLVMSWTSPRRHREAAWVRRSSTALHAGGRAFRWCHHLGRRPASASRRLSPPASRTGTIRLLTSPDFPKTSRPGHGLPGARRYQRLRLARAHPTRPGGAQPPRVVYVQTPRKTARSGGGIAPVDQVGRHGGPVRARAPRSAGTFTRRPRTPSTLSAVSLPAVLSSPAPPGPYTGKRTRSTVRVLSACP